MNREIYIVIGLSVFAFLLGLQLKKWFTKKKPAANYKKQKVHKSQRSKIARQEQDKRPQEKRTKFSKLKTFFLWLQVFVLFFIIIFMVPALSRDVMLADDYFDQKLMLRVLIVALATYTLFIGLNKLFKKRGRW